LPPTKEHLIRRCDGGHNGGNLVLACIPCNSNRDEHSPELWKNDEFRNIVIVSKKAHQQQLSDIRQKYIRTRYNLGLPVVVTKVLHKINKKNRIFRQRSYLFFLARYYEYRLLKQSNRGKHHD
jgi:hypothetical protein